MLVVVGGKCPTACRNGGGIIRAGECPGNMSEGGIVQGAMSYTHRFIPACLSQQQQQEFN